MALFGLRVSDEVFRPIGRRVEAPASTFSLQRLRPVH
jgi:hypothetical protein